MLALQEVRTTNFNSIKVRLELTIGKNGLMQLTHFNSIKVRLELLLPMSLLRVIQHFNSIKVRLERFGEDT